MEQVLGRLFARDARGTIVSRHEAADDEHLQLGHVIRCAGGFGKQPVIVPKPRNFGHQQRLLRFVRRNAARRRQPAHGHAGVVTQQADRRLHLEQGLGRIGPRRDRGRP